jgi:gas vesicle protein
MIKDYVMWKKKSNGRGKIVLGTLAGVAAGLTAGFLTAPRSGREIRTILSTRASDTIDKVGKNFSKTGAKVGTAAEEELKKAESEFK